MGSKKRRLRTLRTAQAEITLTSSHRVIVFENEVKSERIARDLKEGDILQVGTRRQKLAKVIADERDTEAGSTWCRLLCHRSCEIKSGACAYRRGVVMVLKL